MDFRTPRIVQNGSFGYCRWLVLLLGLALALLLAWMAYQPEREPLASAAEPAAGSDRPALQEERIAELESERNRLLEKVAALERTSQIDRVSVQQTRRELIDLQAERSRLEQDLEILQGILRGGIKDEELQVIDFRLQAAAEAGSFNYGFTVSQSLKGSGVATGSIELTVEGVTADEPTRLTLQEMTDPAVDQLKMRFRHFQDVEGVLRLPDDFIPQYVDLQIKPTNKKLAPVSKRFDWVLSDR